MDNDFINTSKQSNLSFALLKEIMTDTNVTTINNIIHIENVPLLDSNGCTLLVFNNESKKLRRKDKNTYNYFNIYANDEQFDMLMDKFYDVNQDIGSIEVNSQMGGIKRVILVKDHADKIVNKSVVVNTEISDNDKSTIIDYLLKRYNIK